MPAGDGAVQIDPFGKHSFAPRPLSFPECHKRFIRSDHLSKHIKTHLQAEPKKTPARRANSAYRMARPSMAASRGVSRMRRIETQYWPVRSFIRSHRSFIRWLRSPHSSLRSCALLCSFARLLACSRALEKAGFCPWYEHLSISYLFHPLLLGSMMVFVSRVAMFC